MKTYEILENGNVFQTRRARNGENAIRAARKSVTIYASDYNTEPGALVELQWTARAVDWIERPVTLTLTARAR